MKNYLSITFIYRLEQEPFGSILAESTGLIFDHLIIYLIDEILVI